MEVAFKGGDVGTGEPIFLKVTLSLTDSIPVGVFILVGLKPNLLP